MKGIYNKYFFKYLFKFLVKYIKRFFYTYEDKITFKYFFHLVKSYIKNFPVTITIFFIMTVLHLLTYIIGNGATNYETARNFGAMITSNRDVMELPYLHTSTYQHLGGMKHYFNNMLSFLILAPLIEKIFGAIKFTFIFNLTGIFGSLATLYFTINNIGSGASGAISGLLGVYLALILKRNRSINWIWIIVVVLQLIFWFKDTFFNVEVNVSVTGHVGGLISGIILGFIFSPKTKSSKNYFHLKSILKYIVITVGLWLILFSFRFTGEKTKEFVENPFGIYSSEINISVIQEIALYNNINLILELYNKHLVENYNVLVNGYNGKTPLEKDELLKMKAEIENDIEKIEETKINKEVKEEAEQLIEILNDLLTLNDMMITYIESNEKDVVLDAKVKLTFTSIYEKSNQIVEKLKVLSEKIGLSEKDNSYH